MQITPKEIIEGIDTIETGKPYTIEHIVDEDEQKITVTWELEWPSTERGHEGKPEKRRGVDIIHFKDGKVTKKLTYSKTTVEVGGKRVKLSVTK